MNETMRMRTARIALQELSASHPAAISNMARHMSALSMLLRGKRKNGNNNPEPIVQSGFELSPGERDLLMAAASRLGTGIVHLAFDVDDAAGEPKGISIFRVEGDLVACYPRCGLWTPSRVGRSVIVPLDEDVPCHFTVGAGGPIARVNGWPAPAIESGLLRGATVLTKLVTSEAMRAAPVRAYRSAVEWRGSDGWKVDTDRVEA